VMLDRQNIVLGLAVLFVARHFLFPEDQVDGVSEKSPNEVAVNDIAGPKVIRMSFCQS